MDVIFEYPSCATYGLCLKPDQTLFANKPYKIVDQCFFTLAEDIEATELDAADVSGSLIKML